MKILASALVGLSLLASPIAVRAATGPVFDYLAPALPASLPHPAILVLSKANGYRHDSIPAVSAALGKLASDHGWTIVDTANAAAFNTRDLKRFDVVILNNTTGDLFTAKQRRAFKRWVKAGGRVVALHGAGGTDTAPWPWYTYELIGARFTGHPPIQTGMIHIEDKASPIVSGLPSTWSRSDEWYSFDRNPRGPNTRVLMTVDEASYTVDDKLRMGSDHPVAWTRCLGKGGSFFAAIGHTSETWSEPVFLSMVDGAIAWALNHDQPAC